MCRVEMEMILSFVTGQLLVRSFLRVVRVTCLAACIVAALGLTFFASVL